MGLAAAGILLPTTPDYVGAVLKANNLTGMRAFLSLYR